MCPAGSLSCPRQPLSRGSNPRGYPHEPLVSYRINRQLSVWNLPPLVIRAFGAHCQKRTHASQQTGRNVSDEHDEIAPPHGLGPCGKHEPGHPDG